MFPKISLATLLVLTTASLVLSPGLVRAEGAVVLGSPSPHSKSVTGTTSNYPELLARRSLAGPRAEMAVGSLLLTATPIVMFMVWVASDPEGYRAHNIDFPYASVAGVLHGSASVALLAHGIRRSARIHGARSTLAHLNHASLQAGPRQASLNVRFSF